MAEFRLQIVTQQRTVFDRSVTALTMPGEDGSFGVLANHAPIISVLKGGPVDIRINSDVTRIRIGGGFFEMESNKATLLADGLEGLTIKDEDE
jgi:F-type H+-transporting ATPase subunit epsilon